MHNCAKNQGEKVKIGVLIEEDGFFYALCVLEKILDFLVLYPSPFFSLLSLIYYLKFII